MSTDSDSCTPGDIERAAAKFAQRLLNDVEVLEAFRKAILGVADVVNDEIEPAPELTGADVVPFLRALQTNLDDAKFQGDPEGRDFDMPIVFIVFGKGKPHP